MCKFKFDKSKKCIRLTLIFFLFSLALVLCACGQSSTMSKIEIKPQQADLSAGNVTIAVDVSNFELLKEGEDPTVSKNGYIIYYMDAPVKTYYQHLPIGQAGTYAISFKTTHVWKDVTPGEHTFSAQLLDYTKSPLPKPIFNKMTVMVGPPKGDPNITVMTPQDGSQIPPGNIIISVGVNNFIISSSDMGVINRKGEGHLIYYIDEEPPIDIGIPAITRTSVVSTNHTYIWKQIDAGKHTFSVQLVNNDDTPLDFPVIMTISIDVTE